MRLEQRDRLLQAVGDVAGGAAIQLRRSLGCEAVGEMDPRLDTVADWKEPFREGVVYYLEKGLVRGVLLWNVWGQVGAARALIAEGRPVPAHELAGRLPA
jgi:hypothetical protein